MKKKTRLISIFLVLILFVTATGCNANLPVSNGSGTTVTSESESDLASLSLENMAYEMSKEIGNFADSECAGLFISMYNISDVSEGIFSKNRGVPTYLCDYICPDSFDNLMIFLDTLTNNERAMGQLQNLILGIDPELMDLDDEKVARIKELADDFANCRVEVVYSTHPYSHWEKEQEALDAQLEKYERCVRLFYRHFPAEQYYFTSELFIVGNKNCFKAGTEILEGNVINKMLLYSLCDGGYKTDYFTFPEEEEKLKKNLRYVENNSLPLEGIYKGETVIFLGDSIFGHYTYPTSITAVFNGLTEGEAVNCGIGGMSLINDDKYYKADTLLNALTTDTTQSKADFEIFKNSYIVPENTSDLATGKNYLSGGKEGLTVMIEFGINDYLFDYSAAEFIDAYDTFCTALDNNPSVKTVIPVLPPFPSETIGRSGKVNQGNVGGTVEDYRDAIRIVSERHGYFFLDLAMIPEFTEDKEVYFLPDGIHYNENGRYIIARRMAEFMTRYYQ